MIDLLDAARERQDFRDKQGWRCRFIGGIDVRHDRTLDWSYIQEQPAPLAEAKEEPEIPRQLVGIRRLCTSL
jgi:hypothetical protein